MSHFFSSHHNCIRINKTQFSDRWACCSWCCCFFFIPAEAKSLIIGHKGGLTFAKANDFAGPYETQHNVQHHLPCLSVCAYHCLCVYICVYLYIFFCHERTLCKLRAVHKSAVLFPARITPKPKASRSECCKLQLLLCLYHGLRKAF